MKVELKSDWQDVQVELLKQLNGYEMKHVDKEMGSVDYIAEEDDEDRKLLRVIVGPKFNASKVFVDIVHDTVEKLEEEEFEEAIILAKDFTSSSKRIIREDDRLEMISSDSKYYSIHEMLEAIMALTMQLCKSRCGGIPETEEECRGRVDGEYSCRVRMISDDADFHARMGWLELLKNDFSMLVDLQRGKAN